MLKQSLDLTSHLTQIKEDVFTRKGSFIPGLNPFLRDVALWKASQKQQTKVQTRARLLYELVQMAPLAIFPGWTLAGEHLIPSPDGSMYGFYTPGYQDFLPRIYELGIHPDDLDSIQSVLHHWSQSPLSSPANELPRNDWLEVSENDRRNPGYGTWSQNISTTVYWAHGWIENHSIRDYAKVLRMGFRGIRQEIETLLDTTDIADPAFPQKEHFWHAALSICDAGILLGERYAELARSKAQDAAEAGVGIIEVKRLEAMADACSHVPAGGASTFHEAVQSLWLAHVLTCGEDGINANSIGRLDQILYPYYAADIQAGRLTRLQAVELMEELACKLYLDYEVQNIILGGVDKTGQHAVTELSSIILEATRNVNFVRDLCIRLDRSTPYPFIRQAAALISHGGGIPFIFNDDCFIPALHEHGIPLEDARDYAPIGCIELTIPGKANPHAVSGWFNAAKCLELALFDGKDPQTGTQLGPQTGLLTDLPDYAALWAAYCQQVEFFSKGMVYHCNRGELAQREASPLPCWSTLTDDCIPRGRDITNGGAVYNYHSICFLGTANTADSLIAIKKLIYEDKVVSAGELLDALRTNFQDSEPLRRMLLNKAPKYGNDQLEVDLIASQVANQFIDLMDQARSPLDGRYFVHLFSFRVNIDFGKAVGATPDGRRAGEPLAYSLSAMQGRDENGVAALINSVARMPHRRAAGASAAIIEINPTLVKGEEGIDRLAQIIQSAIQLGVGQMQWNVVTAEQLKKAQQDPEHYGNLEVRVAGYSQKFKLIPRELQDHIIARTKHEQ